MYERLKDKETAKHFNLDEAIKAGVKLQHLKMGVTNDGLESILALKELYDGIIKEWHGFDPADSHVTNTNADDLEPFSLDAATVDK